MGVAKMKKLHLLMLAILMTVIFILGVSQSKAEYGAIAYSSSTGRCGYSQGHGSADGAIAAAKANCGESDCVWKAWFRDSCGALARAESGATGYSHGFNNMDDAKKRALAECQNRGSNCRLICWACSGNRHHRRNHYR